ncbi:MAG: T9SS type A sorting domain-containing protein [Bacteroidia bacterium]|nr:T9SS type A sorting domain-containing protein [Bacteroidia bacterium]
MKKLTIIIFIICLISSPGISQIPNAGPDQTVCGTSAQLQGVICPGGVGLWTCSNAWFANPSIPTTMITVTNIGVSSFIVDTFIWTVNCGGTIYTDTVNITFVQTPYANAGFDDYIGGNAYSLDADITGNEYAFGTWSENVLPVTYDNVHFPNATVTFPNTGSIPPMPPSGSFGDSSYVIIPFVWEMNNNDCIDYDTVNITFYQVPVAFAGNDTTVYSTDFDFNADYSIGQSTGSWSQINGPGIANFTDIHNPHSHVVVNQYGSYKFKWLEKNLHNPTCFSSDTVTVIFLINPNNIREPGNEMNITNLVYQVIYNHEQDNILINISLDKPTDAHADVYDLLGRSMYSKSNNNLVPGEHTITIPCDLLNSGLYFVNITTNTIKSSHKIMIIK